MICKLRRLNFVMICHLLLVFSGCQSTKNKYCRPALHNADKLQPVPVQPQDALCLAFSELARQRNILDYYCGNGSFRFGLSQGRWCVTFHKDAPTSFNEDVIIVVQTNRTVTIINGW